MADKQEAISSSSKSDQTVEKELDNMFAEKEKDSHGMFVVGSYEAAESQSGASTACDPERKSTSVQPGAGRDDVTPREGADGGDVTAQGHVGASSQSRDQSHDRMETEATPVVASATNLATTTANTQQPAENLPDVTKDATATTVGSSGGAAHAPQPVTHGNVVYFQQEADSNTPQAKSGDGTTQGITIPRADSKDKSSGKGSTPPTPPNTPGILDRTLGSLSSIGSPISSKLTKVVDFSSGLFVRNTEAQGSVVDFADMYPELPGIFTTFHIRSASS